MAEGKVVPLIDSVVPLEQVCTATGPEGPGCKGRGHNRFPHFHAPNKAAWAVPCCAAVSALDSACSCGLASKAGAADLRTRTCCAAPIRAQNPGGRGARALARRPRAWQDRAQGGGPVIRTLILWIRSDQIRSARSRTPVPQRMTGTALVWRCWHQPPTTAASAFNG